MRQTRSYDKKFKAQAVKLTQEIGTKRAAEEPGIPARMLGDRVHAMKSGDPNVSRIVRPNARERMQRLCGNAWGDSSF